MKEGKKKERKEREKEERKEGRYTTDCCIVLCQLVANYQPT
jgi:hypothetical protein